MNDELLSLVKNLRVGQAVRLGMFTANVYVKRVSDQELQVVQDVPWLSATIADDTLETYFEELELGDPIACCEWPRNKKLWLPSQGVNVQAFVKWNERPADNVELLRHILCPQR